MTLAAAVVLLCWARLLVEWVPFSRWRGSLGPYETGYRDPVPTPASLAEARRLAAGVEKAAARLPIATKCLPRAMALSWMLRRRHIRHAFIFAVRPSDKRDAPDALHAWVEVDGATIIGDLPGPWLETLRLGQ